MCKIHEDVLKRIEYFESADQMHYRDRSLQLFRKSTDCEIVARQITISHVNAHAVDRKKFEQFYQDQVIQIAEKISLLKELNVIIEFDAEKDRYYEKKQ